MADEKEQAVGRRLLEHFEQGIRAGSFEIIDTVDHGNPPVRHRRTELEQLGEAAHLIDADVAR